MGAMSTQGKLEPLQIPNQPGKSVYGLHCGLTQGGRVWEHSCCGKLIFEVWHFYGSSKELQCLNGQLFVANIVKYWGRATNYSE